MDRGSRAAHQRRLAELLPPLRERLLWSADRVAAERERGLRALIAAAQQGSRWHRGRLAGVRSAEVTEHRLRLLPVMTKRDLMDNYDDVVTDAALTRERCESHLSASPGEHLLGQYRVVASGGSSGVRGVFVYGWDAWATCYASIVRWQQRDWDSDPQLAGVARVTAVVGASHVTHLSAALGQSFSTMASPRILFPVDQPLGKIVEGLNALQPTVLMAYASYLPHLVGRVEAGQLRIHPRRVIAISEPLLPEVRAGVERAWGAPVASGYGMSEGLFAGSCGRALHLPDDLCIVEPVTGDGDPVDDGEPADRLLVTILYNPTLPLIRFDVTDQLTLSHGQCECGSTMSTITDPQGRLDDVFTYPGDITVHPHVFRSVLGSEAAVTEYRVIQTTHGAQVQVVASDPINTDTILRRLHGALGAVGLPEPVVVVEQVSDLPRQPSGKLRRFSPLPLSDRARGGSSAP